MERILGMLQAGAAQSYVAAQFWRHTHTHTRAHTFSLLPIRKHTRIHRFLYAHILCYCVSIYIFLCACLSLCLL